MKNFSLRSNVTLHPIWLTVSQPATSSLCIAHYALRINSEVVT